MTCSSCGDVLSVIMTTIMICGPPPNINNGSYHGPDTALPGTLYNYTCNDGFAPLGVNSSNTQVECLENGEYSQSSDELATCLRGCKTPHELEFGEYNEVLVSGYEIGQNISFSCGKGYYIYPENGILECGESDWSEGYGCLSECPEPSLIEFSTFNMTKKLIEGVRVSGTQITYFCDDQHAFMANETDTITCQMDGTWDVETLPECLPICEVSPEIENGAKSVVNKFTLDDGTITEIEVEYSCLEGYIMYPANRTTLMCHPGPAWEPASPPQCLGICPELTPTEGMTIVTSNEIFPDMPVTGTMANITCDENFFISDYNLALIECGPDGDWGTIPTCIRDCGYADEIEKGEKSVTHSVDVITKDGIVSLAQNVDYECDSGYGIHPITSNKLTCGAEGTFEAPECLIMCETQPELPMALYPSIITNTYSGRRLEGTQLQYTCKQFYELILGDGVMSCGSDGKWSGRLGSCIQNCGQAPELEHGTKTVSYPMFYNDTYNIELEVQYSCDEGRVLVPDVATWTCESVGSRPAFSSSVPPQCLYECPAPPSGGFASFEMTNDVMDSRYLSGVEVAYTCDDDSQVLAPQDSRVLTCDSNGNWTQDSGSCHTDCGPAPEGENFIKILTNATYYNATYNIEHSITYECVAGKSNFAPEPASIHWECQSDGTWSSSTLPDCQTDCGHPWYIHYAHINYLTKPLLTHNVAGTSYEYVCHDNFLLQGPKDIYYCDGVTETWNYTIADVPRCVLEPGCTATYEFTKLEETGNFTEIRQMCIDLGGDLMWENMGWGARDNEYFEAMYNLTDFGDLSDPHIYIGATDEEVEGTWRFMDMVVFDWKREDGVDIAYPWFNAYGVREPNNNYGGEHCLEVTTRNRLNDRSCERDGYGLCEFRTITCTPE